MQSQQNETPQELLDFLKTKNHIVFNELDHTYQNKKTLEYYTSCTQFIKKFSIPFEATLENTLKTRVTYNKTYDEVIKMWAKNGEIANKKGSVVHGCMEQMFKCGFDLTLLPFVYEHYSFKYNVGQTVIPYEEVLYYVRFVKNLNIHNKGGIIKPEEIVYNDEYKIAGQADLVIEYPDCFDIFDYKTNKKIKKFGFQNQKMLEPLDHLDNCHYSIYTLQLSIYAKFLEEELKKPCRGLVLFHMNKLVVPYKLKYMLNEVNLMLENYDAFKRNQN